ncbi:MAG TPA: MarR family winged helix-turn-helix transcriptional regulator [Acidobacteriaceae bacterium]|nr:MarR family winged helix-turn-helix transcriptional regulator [Acidobacteriaceae bacterium]
MTKNDSWKSPDTDWVPQIVADVFHLAGAFRNWGETIAGKVGQTQARWQVLSAASVDDATVPQIARRLGIARQAVQRVADLLVQDGLAKFAKNRAHARSPYLRLTQKGKDLLRWLTKTAETYHRELGAGLSQDILRSTAIALRTFTMKLENDRRIKLETERGVNRRAH